MSPAQKRLIGTWRSDRRQTLQNCHRYHCLQGEDKRMFASLFGTLELQYTPKFIFHTLKQFEYRARYDVVAEDAQSIVIRLNRDGLKDEIDPIILKDLEPLFEPVLQHITFVRRRDSQFYWIGLGFGCEWFRKLESD